MKSTCSRIRGQCASLLRRGIHSKQPAANKHGILLLSGQPKCQTKGRPEYALLGPGGTRTRRYEWRRSRTCSRDGPLCAAPLPTQALSFWRPGSSSLRSEKRLDHRHRAAGHVETQLRQRQRRAKSDSERLSMPNIDGSNRCYAQGYTQLILDILGYFAPSAQWDKLHCRTSGENVSYLRRLYSVRAALRTGKSASAPFHNPRKSS